VYRGSRFIARVVQRLEIRVSESLLDGDPVLRVEGQHLLEHVDRMRVRARVNLREPAERWGDSRFECLIITSWKESNGILLSAGAG
jgi:hypothetical protein